MWKIIEAMKGDSLTVERSSRPRLVKARVIQTQQLIMINRVTDVVLKGHYKTMSGINVGRLLTIFEPENVIMKFFLLKYTGEKKWLTKGTSFDQFMIVDEPMLIEMRDEGRVED